MHTRENPLVWIGELACNSRWIWVVVRGWESDGATKLRLRKQSKLGVSREDSIHTSDNWQKQSRKAGISLPVYLPDCLPTPILVNIKIEAVILPRFFSLALQVVDLPHQ